VVDAEELQKRIDLVLDILGPEQPRLSRLCVACDRELMVHGMEWTWASADQTVAICWACHLKGHSGEKAQ